MPGQPQISGLPASLTGAMQQQSNYNVLIRDADAREKRLNILRQQTGPAAYTEFESQVTVVKIDNSLNPGSSAYLKFYDDKDPAMGNDAPLAILMARPGKVAEYLIAIPSVFNFMANMSYSVFTKGGTTGSAKPDNPVIVTMALWAK